MNFLQQISTEIQPISLRTTLFEVPYFSKSVLLDRFLGFFVGDRGKGFEVFQYATSTEICGRFFYGFFPQITGIEQLVGMISKYRFYDERFIPLLREISDNTVAQGVTSNGTNLTLIYHYENGAYHL